MLFMVKLAAEPLRRLLLAVTTLKLFTHTCTVICDWSMPTVIASYLNSRYLELLQKSSTLVPPRWSKIVSLTLFLAYSITDDARRGFYKNLLYQKIASARYLRIMLHVKWVELCGLLIV